MKKLMLALVCSATVCMPVHAQTYYARTRLVGMPVTSGAITNPPVTTPTPTSTPTPTPVPPPVTVTCGGFTQVSTGATATTGPNRVQLSSLSSATVASAAAGAAAAKSYCESVPGTMVCHMRYVTSGSWPRDVEFMAYKAGTSTETYAKYYTTSTAACTSG